MAQTLFNDQIASIILTSLKAGAKRSTAAKMASIHPQTLTRWVNEGIANPKSDLGDFVGQVFKAEAIDETDLLKRLKDTVVSELGAINPTALMFILKARHGWGANAADKLVDYLVAKLSENYTDLLAEILNDLKNGAID
jgi:transposase-like protein